MFDNKVRLKVTLLLSFIRAVRTGKLRVFVTLEALVVVEVTALLVEATTHYTTVAVSAVRQLLYELRPDYTCNSDHERYKTI